MATNLDRAQLVARHVQIQGVNLTQARVHSAVDPFGVPEELELEQSYRSRFELPEAASDVLLVYVELRVSARDASQEASAPVIDLEATYRLFYRLPDAPKYPPDAVRHFAELNVPYNIWPYWRELVQTVSGRAGIASIVIPVFRPPVRKLTPEEEEQLELPVAQAKG